MIRLIKRAKRGPDKVLSECCLFSADHSSLLEGFKHTVKLNFSDDDDISRYAVEISGGDIIKLRDWLIQRTESGS